MKKIITAGIIVSLCAAPWSASAQVGSFASGIMSVYNQLAGDPTGGALGCQGATGGGSLGNALLGGLLNQLPANAGPIISTLLGPNASRTLINSLAGNTSTGRLIGDILGMSTGSGPTGIINNLFGGGSGLGGLNSIPGLGSIANSVPGLGSVAGLLGGGGAVPVNDSVVRNISQQINAEAQQIRTNAQVINTNTGSLLRKECISDPLTRRIAQMTNAQITQNVLDWSSTGFGGAPYWVTNYNQQLGQTYTSANMEFIQGQELNAVSPAYQSRVRTQLAYDLQRKNDFESRVGCSLSNPNEFLKNGTPQDGLDFWGTWKVAISEEPGCTPSGAYFTADNERAAREYARLSEVERLVDQGNGYLPKSRCVSGSGTSILDCTDYEILTPGTTNESVVEYYTLAGPEQLAGTDEMGELVDSLFAQVGSQILTSLGGFLGLSRPSGGTPSFTSSLTGGGTGQSAIQTQQVIQDDIRAAVVLGASYQSILEEMITNLQNTANAYQAVNTCYASFGGSVLISAIVAADRASSAATIVTILTPQITEKTTELGGVQTTNLQLQDILAQSQVVADINLALNAFGALSTANQLYTPTDVTFIANDRDASAVTLTALQAEAATQLAECQA